MHFIFHNLYPTFLYVHTFYIYTVISSYICTQRCSKQYALILICCGMKQVQYVAAYFTRLERARKMPSNIHKTLGTCSLSNQDCRGLQSPFTELNAAALMQMVKFSLLQKLSPNIPELMRYQCPQLGGLVVIFFKVQTRSGVTDTKGEDRTNNILITIITHTCNFVSRATLIRITETD